ncbi:MAG: 3-deoxy-manno-octulosonate cytidylyltransferase [Candidatus Omnitrophica bacterium]|nr:3-deoxy-manno-octulosonate cytidylyltransferase [Candidatus Omnitrophota bacterium]
MKIVAVIPARYQSTRFEGKPLADIHGRPMIYYVYRSAKRATGIQDVFVATDDERIREAVVKFGGKVVMTSPEHKTGTDRIAEAVSNLDVDIVINVQGDEPLVHPEMLEQAMRPLLENPKILVTTLISPIENPADFIDTTVVKTAADCEGNVLFFSRSPIPYPKTRQFYIAYKQVGLYAFRKKFLLEFAAMPPTPLELIEGVELLRAVENGINVRVVETRHKTISVDTLSDLFEVRKVVESEGVIDEAGIEGAIKKN